MPGKLFWLAALAAGGMVLSKQMKKRNAPQNSDLKTVEQTIEVDVPVRTAYNQWTQFEEFPRFMHSVHEVRQLDDTHLHWRASVAGKMKEWDAEITEQIPDERIEWRSTGGTRNGGVVRFQSLGENRTRIILRMDYEPDSAAEKVGGALGGVRRTVKGNLERFKDLIEGRGVETGAWRGTVDQPQVAH